MPPARRASVVHRALEAQPTNSSTLISTSKAPTESVFAPMRTFIVSLSSMRLLRSRGSLIITLCILLSLYGLSILHNADLMDTSSAYPSRSHMAEYIPNWHGLSKYKTKHNHHRPTSYGDDDDLAASSSRPPLQLTEPEELAALVYFISSIGANALPANIDPSVPLDPHLVVDFDTRSENAPAELEALVSDTWERHPIVIFSKLHSPAAKNLKFIIDTYNLRPSPTVVEIDGRGDAEVITPLLYRLTSSTELPILLVGGQPVGSIETVRVLHRDQKLRAMFERSGVVVGGGKKKKGKRRAAAAAAAA